MATPDTTEVTMRFKYWTVRMRPTPMSISTIGVGVIVEDTQSGIIAHRFVKDIKAMLPYFPHQEAVKKQIEELRLWLPSDVFDQNPRLELNPNHTIPGIIDSLVTRWNNLVIVDPSDIMSAPSMEEAINLLFKKLIVFTSQTSKSSKILPELRSKVKKTYESHQAIRPLVKTKPVMVMVDAADEVFDIGIIHDTHIYELNQGFSFHSIDQKQSQHRLEAWIWKISLLRSQGAKLEIRGNHIELDRTTPIIVSYSSPESEIGKPLMSKFMRQLDKLDIDHYNPDDFEAHVSELAAQVA